MHELALLGGVVTAVRRAAGTHRVEAVGLRVGTLCGAVPEALAGAWPLATTGTTLDGARLDLDLVEAAVWCPTCAAEQPIDEFYALLCPACGTPTGALVRGREFEVAYADLAEDAAGHQPAPPVSAAASHSSTTVAASRAASATAPATTSDRPTRRSTDSGTIPTTAT